MTCERVVWFWGVRGTNRASLERFRATWRLLDRQTRYQYADEMIEALYSDDGLDS